MALSTICATEKGAIINRIFLCRHGETEANAKGLLQGSGINLNLNSTGKEQAKALREHVKFEKVDIIVSSKLARARETADIVAEGHPDAKRLEVEELAEISWGEWEGITSPKLPDLLNDWNMGNYSSKAPIGESPIEVERRAVPALYDCILKNRGMNILFVVHGRLLRIILSSILFRNLEHMNEFTHTNCCINVLDTVIDTDESFFGTRSLQDPHNVLRSAPVDAACRKSSTQSTDVFDERTIDTLSAVTHPENLTFVPIAIDDRRHLNGLAD